MLSTFRDPIRSVFDDWTGVDPWGVGTDLLPLSTGGLGSGTAGGRRVRATGRLMTLDAYEDQNEFKVICEVSSSSSLSMAIYHTLLYTKFNEGPRSIQG